MPGKKTPPVVERFTKSPEIFETPPEPVRTSARERTLEDLLAKVRHYAAQREWDAVTKLLEP